VPDGIDVGAPRGMFATPFKGRVAIGGGTGLQPVSPYAMLTCTNEVQLISGWATADGADAQPGFSLPDELRPHEPVSLAVQGKSGGAWGLCSLRIDPDGSMEVRPGPVSELEVNGHSYNVSGRHYAV